jgi:hypothetical protein
LALILDLDLVGVNLIVSLLRVWVNERTQEDYLPATDISVREMGDLGLNVRELPDLVSVYLMNLIFIF